MELTSWRSPHERALLRWLCAGPRISPLLLLSPGRGGGGSCKVFPHTPPVHPGAFQGHRLDLPPSAWHGPLPPLPISGMNTCSPSPELWTRWDGAQIFPAALLSFWVGQSEHEWEQTAFQQQQTPPALGRGGVGGSVAFLLLSSPCSQVIWQWEQDRRWRGTDTSWRRPRWHCRPAVTGVLGALRGTGAVTACMYYHGKCHPGGFLLEFP